MLYLQCVFLKKKNSRIYSAWLDIVKDWTLLITRQFLCVFVQYTYLQVVND